jgi:TetR/AcrR family transcriptional repressor of nem operon
MAGRKRKFTEEELLAKGVTLFWKKGYHACSTQDILTELDINKGTLYQTFQSKEHFFALCIRYAEDQWLETCTARIKVSESPLEIIEEIIISNCQQTQERRAMGCLLGNTLMENTFLNEELKNLAAHYLESLRTLFTLSIERAIMLHQLPSSTNVAATADILLTLWNGINITKRMNRSNQELKQIIQHTLNSLNLI